MEPTIDLIDFVRRLGYVYGLEEREQAEVLSIARGMGATKANWLGPGTATAPGRDGAILVSAQDLHRPNTSAATQPYVDGKGVDAVIIDPSHPIPDLSDSRVGRGGYTHPERIQAFEDHRVRPQTAAGPPGHPYFSPLEPRRAVSRLDHSEVRAGAPPADLGYSKVHTAGPRYQPVEYHREPHQLSSSGFARDIKRDAAPVLDPGFPDYTEPSMPFPPSQQAPTAPPSTAPPETAEAVAAKNAGKLLGKTILRELARRRFGRDRFPLLQAFRLFDMDQTGCLGML